MLGFLWRQWASMGVAGYAKRREPWVIDPEALLLFSTEIARQDPRLFDEILDWLHDQAGWISLQRLSRMRAEHSFGSDTVLCAIAEHLTRESSNQKWKVVWSRKAVAAGAAAQAGPQPLFPEAGQFGENDSIFLKWGWQRSPVRYRGLGSAPRFDHPGPFLLKLRSLFGRQSRAEIIAWLLANESGHPAKIARQTGYFRRSVQVVLNELEVSGHVRARRVGREKHFAILHEQWRFLANWENSDTFPSGFPRWIIWPAVFELLDGVRKVLFHPDLESMSTSLTAIELRTAITDANLPATGLPTQLQPATSLKGEAFLNDTLLKLQQFLDPTNAPALFQP
ncbi:MAG: hypothetical protein ACP5I4_17105 [Oceanipulchritudo sp.]